MYMCVHVWGESRYHQRSLTSSQRWAFSVLLLYTMYVMFVWSGSMGCVSFLKIPVWLVRYAHGFHVHVHCKLAHTYMYMYIQCIYKTMFVCL